VFDIEEIVHILRREKLENIFVVSVPPDIKYVDYIVVVTGKSKRQMSAVAEFIRKLYKKKRHHYDLIPRIEGENSKDWMALDLGRYIISLISVYKIISVTASELS
jgi:ribosomal silencing factor RsfS